MIELKGITAFMMIEVRIKSHPTLWLPGAVQYIDGKSVKVELFKAPYLPDGIELPAQKIESGMTMGRYRATEETILEWRTMTDAAHKRMKAISNEIAEAADPTIWEPCDHKMTIYLTKTDYDQLIEYADIYRGKPATAARVIIETFLENYFDH